MTREHAAGKDAPDVWFDHDDDIWVYRASSLGSCPRALLQHRLGHPAEPFPKMLQGKFEEGKAAEPVILRILQARYGWTSLPDAHRAQYGPLDDDGQPCVELHLGLAVVRAHPDDIVKRFKAQLNEDEDWQIGKRAVVEIKALSEGMFEQWQRQGPGFMSTYEWQLAVQMHATRLPGLHVVGVKGEDGKVLADRVYVHHQLEPPKSFVEIVKRVREVEVMASAVEAGEATIDDMPCEVCWPCGFYTRPNNACARKQVEAIDDETTTKATSIAQAYHAARENEARWKTKAEELRDQMVEVLGTQARTVEVGSWQVTVTVPQQGNVSWAKVAQKYVPDVDVEPFRGKPGKPSIQVKKVDNKEQA